MKSNYQRTADWLYACGKVPGHAGDLSVQFGCMAEEFREVLDAMSFHKPGASPESSGWREVVERIVADIEAVGKALKKGELLAYVEPHKREDLLDGLCDVEVTLNGVAYLAGFDKDGADQEVLASNESKLENGKAVILPGGKVGKGASYKAPNLRGFV